MAMMMMVMMMLVTVMMLVLLVMMMMIMLVMMGTESHSIFFSITPLLGVNGYSGHDDMEINFSIIRCQINMVVIVKMVLKMIIKIR